MCGCQIKGVLVCQYDIFLQALHQMKLDSVTLTHKHHKKLSTVIQNKKQCRYMFGHLQQCTPNKIKFGMF